MFLRDCRRVARLNLRVGFGPDCLAQVPWVAEGWVGEEREGGKNRGGEGARSEERELTA
mgnify:CR=1 FL=1